MHALFGYLICLLVLTPAFSVDVFFALIGATHRLHDVLGIVRALSRVLQSVTSPFKIGLALIVLLAVFASESHRFTRGLILLVASTVAAAGVLQTALLHLTTGLETSSYSLAGWTVATLAGLAAGTRLLELWPARAVAHV